MITYKMLENLAELDKISKDYPTFADIETEKLYINPRLIQLYQPQTMQCPLLIDLDLFDLQEVLSKLKDKWLVFHNASYDLGTLNFVPDKVDDTLYLCKTAYPRWKEYSLDKIAKRLKVDYYDGMDKKQLQKLGFKKGSYLSSLQLRYAAADVLTLAEIWKLPQLKLVRETNKAYKLDIYNLKYAIKYQQNGLIPDLRLLQKELDECNVKIKENEQYLGSLNANSPKQVKEALGTEGSSKDILIKLINKGNHLAKLVYDQRRLLKRRTMLESYRFPKVYTKFNIAGAATGRFTSTGGDLPNGINAQQIPRDLQYLFNQNTENTIAIHADFSTAELRAGCSIMHDRTMYQELKNGIDLHKAAASLVTGKPLDQITKADRQKGKAVSFGFIFGMSAPTFVEYAFINYGVKFTLEEAKEIKRKYNAKYKQIAAYHDYWWKHYKDEQVQSPLGRRNMARLGTDAINYATQSCIAETTKLAIHLIVKETNEEVLKYIYNVVHDAIYLRVPKGMEYEWAEILQRNMLKAWIEMSKAPLLKFKDIPMGVEYDFVDSNGNKILKEVFNEF
jgi:DNA polymerase I-like protein with 3'-5' exonuclease and polymerase domains